MLQSPVSTQPEINFANDVFVAYSWKNKRFVDRLVSDLKDHHITVWMDRLELTVGDRTRQKIETAIQTCRYFCRVISKASLKSYYVRQLELEAAFTRMVQDGRESFILPLLRQRLGNSLPLMLSSILYLDCITPTKYQDSLNKLVRKIKLGDELFTGQRIYKNVDTSFSGQMIGVGELNEVSYRGFCIRVFFHDGIIRSLETITDGVEDGVKSIIYDNQGRVSEIVLFRNNRVVDTWRYIYDPKSGQRIKKLMIRPGQEPHVELVYDAHGRRIAENSL